MKVLAAGLSAAVALAAIAASARADGVGIIGYQAGDAPAPAARGAAAMARAIEAAGSKAVLDPRAIARARIAEGAVPRERLRDFVRARELMNEGWRAYLSVNRSFAAARLGEARRVAEGVLDLDGGPALVAEISLRLGVVVMDLGRPGQARDLFRLAHRLEPGRAVTIAEFSPDVVAAFDAAVAATPPTARVTLRVPGGPAQVAIDGGDPADAPRVVDLEVGQHVAVARRPHGATRGMIFEVAAGGGDVSLELEQDPLIDAVRAPLGLGRGEDAGTVAVEALTMYGELDSLVLVATVWRRGQPALLGQMCAGAPARCGAVVEIRFAEPSAIDAAARALWAALVDAGTDRAFPPTLLVDRRVVDGEPPPGADSGKHRGDRHHWWKSPYLWIGVGVVAASVSAALIVGRDRPLQPTIGGMPCEFTGSCN